MARDHSRTTAQLEATGMATLLHQLLSGPLMETKEYNFSSIRTAKRIQALLYNWLWFYPGIKARTSMKLNEETATLYIISRSVSEKRGRKKK